MIILILNTGPNAMRQTSNFLWATISQSYVWVDDIGISYIMGFWLVGSWNSPLSKIDIGLQVFYIGDT